MSQKDKMLCGELLGGCNESFTIEPSVWFDYGYNISIGENFYSNHNLVILVGAKVASPLNLK